jgi:hypothetical protein
MARKVANASRFFESDGSGFHSQAGYALGERADNPLRCELPAYDEEYWQS